MMTVFDGRGLQLCCESQCTGKSALSDLSASMKRSALASCETLLGLDMGMIK